jgi:hypothetical protein
MSVYRNCKNQYGSKIITKPVTWTTNIQNTVYSSMWTIQIQNAVCIKINVLES